jgi:hypothetical protein
LEERQDFKAHQAGKRLQEDGDSSMEVSQFKHGERSNHATSTTSVLPSHINTFTISGDGARQPDLVFMTLYAHFNLNKAGYNRVVCGKKLAKC